MTTLARLARELDADPAAIAILVRLGKNGRPTARRNPANRKRLRNPRNR